MDTVSAGFLRAVQRRIGFVDQFFDDDVVRAGRYPNCRLSEEILSQCVS
jgi:hypothetical protein